MGTGSPRWVPGTAAFPWCPQSPAGPEALPVCPAGAGLLQVELDRDSGDKQKGLATKGPASSRLLLPTTSTTRAVN